MDVTDDAPFGKDEVDRVAQLVEILMKRIEQLELTLTKNDENIASDRKLLTLGDEIFTPETTQKRRKKRRQSAELKLLKVCKTLINIKN
jgi:hypothetical protein